MVRAPVGGAFRHVWDLAAEQTRRGMSVGVVCGNETGHPQTTAGIANLQALCALGVHQVTMSRWPALIDVRNVAHIRAILGRIPPHSILHGHGAKGGLYARLLAPRLRGVAVYTTHGGSLHYHNSVAGRLLLQVERLLLPLTRGIIFESEYSSNLFHRYVAPPKCPTALIHHGIPAPAEASHAQASAMDFLYLGELRRLKGADLLLQACRLLRDRGYLCTLCIVGSGPDARAFLALAAALGVQTQVAWLKPMYPPHVAFSSGRCVVVPSRSESFGYVTLEAAATGVPVIATDVGAARSILGNEEPASVVTPGNVTALATAMERWLRKDLGTPDVLARRLARVRREFSLDQMVTKTSAFYAAVLARAT